MLRANSERLPMEVPARAGESRTRAEQAHVSLEADSKSAIRWSILSRTALLLGTGAFRFADSAWNYCTVCDPQFSGDSTDHTRARE